MRRLGKISVPSRWVPRVLWSGNLDSLRSRLVLVVLAGAFALALIWARSPTLRALCLGILVLIGLAYASVCLVRIGLPGGRPPGIGLLAADAVIAALLFLATGSSGLSHLFLLLPIVDASLGMSALVGAGATLVVIAFYACQVLCRMAGAPGSELRASIPQILVFAVAAAAGWVVLAVAGSLVGSMRRSRREAEIVAELAGWNRSPEEVKRFCAALAAVSCEVVGGSGSSVFLLAGEGEALELAATYPAGTARSQDATQTGSAALAPSSVEALLQEGEIVAGDLGHRVPAVVDAGLAGGGQGVVVPLRDDARARGLLVISAGGLGRLTGREERVLRMLGAQAARFLADVERSNIAQEAWRLLARTLQQREQADRLADVMAACTDWSRALEEALRSVMGVFSAPAGGILVKDVVNSLASYEVVHGLWAESREIASFPLGEEGASAGFLGARPAACLIDIERLARLAGTEMEFAQAALATGLRAMISVPLGSGEGHLGALHLFWREPGRAEHVDRAALTQAARWLRLALTRVRVDRDLGRRLEGLAVLDHFSQDVETPHALDDVLTGLLTASVQIVGCRSACALVWEEERKQLVLHSSVGPLFADIGEGRAFPHGGVSPAMLASLDAHGPVFFPDTESAEPWLSLIPFEELPAGAFMPIVTRGSLVAIVCLGECGRSQFDDVCLDLLRSLSRHAAAATEHVRLFDEVRERESELEDTVRRLDESIKEQKRANIELSVLHNLSVAIQSTIRLDEILGIVVEGVRQSLGFKRVLLSLLDDVSMRLERKAAAGVAGEEFEDIRRVTVPVEDLHTLLREEFRISNSYLITHTDAERAQIRRYIERYGYAGPVDDVAPESHEEGRWHPGNIFVVPLRSKDGRLLGIMSVDSPIDGQIPSEERVRSLEAFASSATLAIENAKMYEDASRMLSGLSGVSEISSAIGMIRHLEELLEEVVEIIHRKFAYLNVALLLVDAERDELYVAASKGYEETDLADLRLRVGKDGVTGWVAHTGQAQLIPDTRREPRYVGDKSGPKSEIAVPLLTKSGIIGVLDVEREGIHSLREYDLSLLGALSTHISVAIENAKLYEQTERLAVTDAMTGLYNYRYLQERLADEVERAERRGQRLCLMMADIDNFKTYNDTFGHLRGDEVLRDMALLLQENVRQMDVVTRYGGDEFMIILPETDRDEALSIAERIRLRVGSWGLQAGLGPSAGEIGVSIGIAVYPDDAESADLLIDKVDKALYRAKEFREVGISFLYTDGGKG